MSWRVYRAFDADGALLYVGCSSSLKSRFAGHRSASAPWLAVVARVDFIEFATREAALAVEAAAIREERPAFNRRQGITGKTKGIDHTVILRLQPHELAALDEWRLRQAGARPPSRPAALRRIAAPIIGERTR